MNISATAELEGMSLTYSPYRLHAKTGCVYLLGVYVMGMYIYRDLEITGSTVTCRTFRHGLES